MVEYFIEWGYVGLFVAAFLAATILPLSSELVLVSLLLTMSFSSSVLVVVATIGNVLGSLANYTLGYYVGQGIMNTRVNTNSHSYQRSLRITQKYGLFALVLSWVPIIGDQITALAGFFKLKLSWFVLIVSVVKCLRYVIVCYLTVGV